MRFRTEVSCWRCGVGVIITGLFFVSLPYCSVRSFDVRSVRRYLWCLFTMNTSSSDGYYVKRQQLKSKQRASQYTSITCCPLVAALHPNAPLLSCRITVAFKGPTNGQDASWTVVALLHPTCTAQGATGRIHHAQMQDR